MLLNRLTYVHKCLSKWPKNIPLKVVWTRNLILAPCQVCDSCVLRRCENSDHRSSLQDGFSIRFRYVQTSPIIDMRNDEIIKDNNNNDVEGGDRTFGSSVTKVRGWKEKDWLKELVTSTNSALSPQQWKQTKMNALAERLFVAGNFESRVMLTCSIFHNFSLAKSLMDYMECEQITPNIVTLSKYLRLCGDYEGEPNEKQIMTIFHRITDNQSLFDSATAEDVIHGLCRTSAWKESFRFLDMIKRTCDTPSSSVLLPIILAAFRNKDYEVGWNLMGELVLRCQGSMLIDAIKAWLVECTNADEISRFPMVDKLLRFLNKHEVIISREVAQIIKYCFERCCV